MSSEARYILGVSAYYHDSAAALLRNGDIVAAAQEERFSRKKHDPAFPRSAVEYVLEEAGIGLKDVEAIAFYEKPFLKFERLLETYHAVAPRGLVSFLTAMPVWIKEKLFMRTMLEEGFAGLADKGSLPAMHFPEHHLSHAASAFYPSPFSDAAVLTVDGVGEWTSTSLAYGKGRDLRFLREMHFPHSLGLLYSAFTAYCGFKVNSGEYKLMGLAPYGDPESDRVARFEQKIRDELVDIREDGSFLLNPRYFAYLTDLRMYEEAAWTRLFGFPPRQPESEDMGQEYMDMALAIQNITEDIILRLATTLRDLTNSRNICLAGGVALNCVANGKLQRSGLFERVWIQPASGDAGGALGAALALWHIGLEEDREPAMPDAMHGSYLGPEYGQDDIARVAKKYHAPCERFAEDQNLFDRVADLVNDGAVVGWFQGRMEYGPRALGNRSILGDPRKPEMQKRLNLKIKFREGFRPFAPSVAEEEAAAYFDHAGTSPYMLITCPVSESIRKALPEDYNRLPMMERLYHQRSDLPAVTHVNYSARLQTVSRNTNPRYHGLLQSFCKRHGCPVLVNTSFNVRGEPIVCTPEDAYRCFMRTEMDYLVMGNSLFAKNEQPAFPDAENWQEVYALD